eukprot:TRINITY_DN19249_c0_g2_i1.p1 TRINITY_DN19249_c0_g2~~TRINITY_DN19249_c0_g2_i1.p1  ORF type:complete len:254 (-),score=8.52 TRINITY_DN19249_c0_g2_i1:392-1153(-)
MLLQYVNTQSKCSYRVEKFESCLVRSKVAPIQSCYQNGHGRMPSLSPLDGDYERRMCFTPFANWVIKGRLMLGRYPYVEPSRCRLSQVGKKQLDKILSQNIDTFVCLQEELPPQQKLRPTGKRGFLPYDAYCKIVAGEKNFEREMLFLHYPIVDLDIPSQRQMEGLVSEMIELLQEGRNIYLHCWGGRGRAGTVGACLLAKLYGVSTVEALARIQRAFDTRRDGGRQSPETKEQRVFVNCFVSNLEKAIREAV